jgi:type IV pilus assembly protein PilQ
VTRLEFTLASTPELRLEEIHGGLRVHLTVPGAAESASPAAVTTPPASSQHADVLPLPSSGRTLTVRNISVTQGPEGVELEIQANGPLSPQTMRVENPDRLVIDLPGALPVRARKIDVNTPDVKSVRMSRYQDFPPTTRIVVDLLATRTYQVLPEGNTVRVKLRNPAVASAPASTPTSVPVSVAPSASQSVMEVATQPTSTAEPATSPSSPIEPISAPPEQPVTVAATAPATVPEKPASSPPPAPISTPQVQPNPPATQPVMVASAAPPSNAPAPPTSAPQNFVMVEPKFQPKAETAAPAQPDPNLRAADAASKFASNMKPVPLSSRPATDHPTAMMATAMPEPQAQPAKPAAQAKPAQPLAQPPLPGKPAYTGEPISVNLKDVDLKDFFRLIHEISGLNIVLDPNVKGTLTLVLDDVPWDQALDIVLKNNGLDRELDGNVLRIATIDTLRKESDARRAQIEAKVLAEPKITVTRFLSYAHAKDVVPTIKKFLSARGEIISDDRTNGLIIQDIPGVFPEIDRLLTQLDRKTPEVEIEARVVAATRNFARDIGTQIGFAWGNTPSAVGGASTAGNSPIQVGQAPGAPPPPFITAPSGTSIPLFSNLPAISPTSGLSFLNLGNNHRLDAILTMAESRGLLKILSRPRVITQNNIQAVIRQGFKIPVVTLAQLGGPPTTTYIDAFLRLTVTPQITVENTIFLNVDVENTTPDFGRVINGNPTLITQQALTQVLVADGGTVVIGGVIETQNSVNISQVPLLGDIPVLGNLFKRRSVSSTNRELFFFITPRIIQT